MLSSADIVEEVSTGVEKVVKVFQLVCGPFLLSFFYCKVFFKWLRVEKALEGENCFGSCFIFVSENFVEDKDLSCIDISI